MVQSQDLDAEAWAVAGSYMSEAYSVSTIKGLDSGYRAYLFWCHEHNRIAIPASPSTLVLHYTSRKHLSLQSMTLSVKAVALLHRYYGLDSPNNHQAVRALLKKHRKTVPEPTPKTALSYDDVCEMVRRADAHPHPIKGERDAAVLLVLFATAGRGAEIAAASPNHITFFPEGMTVIIPESKGDQFNEGQTIFVDRTDDPRFCGVSRLEAWLEHNAGPSLFPQLTKYGKIRPGTALGTTGIRSIVKSYVALIGYDPADYGSHSTRSGFITDALDLGIKDNLVQQRARHKHLKTTHKYKQTKTESAPSLMKWFGA
jgi:integrase